GCKDVVVLERAISPGAGGILGVEVKAALMGMKRQPVVHEFAVGLGGRDIPLETWPRLMDAVARDEEPSFSILDVELEKLPVEER
ncbi:MAG: pyruvate ferredoxin oxidoreductase, partial [Alphaproteobacteria bacterium]|nr:pyruvate ferredoxin oxidoreductase [Alphaproteobacteria bacterium]